MKRAFVPERVAKILEAVSYKPGWKIRVELGGEWEPKGSLIARIVAPVSDVDSGTITYLHSEPAVIHPKMTEVEIVELIFKAIRGTEIHECAEQFRYRKIQVYNPHKDHKEQEVLMDVATGFSPRSLDDN